MDKKLTDRVAIVTGASRGIGAEIARRLAEEGCGLCLNYVRSSSAMHAVAEDCRRLGVEVTVEQGDVGEEQAARALARAAVAKFGRVDILVNNAGILTQAKVEDMPVRMWDEMIVSDLRSVFLCTRFVLPHMLKQRFGRIINISSQLAQKGGVELAHYSAAKAGVIGFTKSLAREVSDRGVTVNCVAPGPIDTAMVASLSEEWQAQKKAELPIPRWGTVEEVAGSVIFFASEPDGNIYTGQTLAPNCGDVML